MKKKVFMGLGLLFMVVTLSSCATLFAKNTKTVAFESDPPVADVYVNGVLMGQTPLSLDLPQDENYTVQFKKDGYVIQTELINSSMGIKWLILDILGGGIPIIVDAITGDWMQLDRDNVSVFLAPEK